MIGIDVLSTLTCPLLAGVDFAGTVAAFSLGALTWRRRQERAGLG